MRLDVYLAQKTGRSRQQIKRYIKEGLVKVSGRVVQKPSFLIKNIQTVEYDLPPPFILQPPTPEAMPIDVLYEDDQIAVVNKPAGLVVHPAHKSPHHTLAHGLLARFGELPVLDDPMKPGIVHRLDKGTSGCLVVAKTKEALLNLRGQFQKRTVDKTYLALVVGLPKKEGRIEKKIGWHSKRRYKISSHTKKGKEAITTWRVLETFGQKFSWVEIKIFTGRTHQIRVHFAEAGHPVAGDPTYGKRAKVLSEWISRPALHAWKLGFQHPATGKKINAESPLPSDLKNLLSMLKKEKC
ncbi:MAG: RluA family pseudouridine synthase [Deltaproteobacteria bacterium]|nr:RluA family pseudouridine synthase [Deltaproteobacteria bacterium]